MQTTRVNVTVEVGPSLGDGRTVTVPVEEWELMTTLLDTYQRWGEGEVTTATLDEIEGKYLALRAGR